jgi:glycosyltransferase involved in cell wall biosynthesis
VNAEPLVSVCIRSHGRVAGLRRAIDSVLAQRYARFELVVSDDLGASEALVRGFADGRIRYHRAPTGAGPAGNLRSGLREARGDLLTMLDDDDIWDPRFLSTMVPCLTADPTVGVAFANYRVAVGSRRLPSGITLRAGRHQPFLDEVLAGSRIAFAAGMMRRAVWEECERELPLVDDGLGVTSIWLHAAAAGWAFELVGEPLMERRIHAKQIYRNAASTRREIVMLERFRFADPHSEGLRTRRLAEARLRIAHADLRRGRFRAARLAIAQARSELDRPFGRPQWLALSGLHEIGVPIAARFPAVFGPLRSAWRWARRS